LNPSLLTLHFSTIQVGGMALYISSFQMLLFLTSFCFHVNEYYNESIKKLLNKWFNLEQYACTKPLIKYLFFSHSLNVFMFRCYQRSVFTLLSFASQYLSFSFLFLSSSYLDSLINKIDAYHYSVKKRVNINFDLKWYYFIKLYNKTKKTWYHIFDMHILVCALCLLSEKYR